jgi:tellurium resistance protein TerD
MSTQFLGGTSVASINKGISKAEVGVKWDPSPAGSPAADLDVIAGTYSVGDPYGKPVHLVSFASRSPDGTITLNRDSQTGRGLGYDEVMTLELDRMAAGVSRVVVGVAIQQRAGRLTFGRLSGTGVRVVAGVEELARDDLGAVAESTAAVIVEFVRDGAGAWSFHKALRGFDTDPASFAAIMGSRL